MNKAWTRAGIFITASMLAIFIPLNAAAQSTPQQQADDAAKSKTTSDAWRDALPQGESQVVAGDESGNSGRKTGEESFARIEKNLTALEYKWMEAIKLHNTNALKGILSEDFTLASESSTVALSDRNQYLDSIQRDAKLESYNFDKMTVRVYGTTAIVNIWGKQQSLTANGKTNAHFLYTDIWVREGTRWRVVMRHADQPAASR